ncbi:MAG: DUF6273 domain-containing protein [bacterium]|nr:DUF6273 domain-containing protein [bacterium]
MKNNDNAVEKRSKTVKRYLPIILIVIVSIEIIAFISHEIILKQKYNKAMTFISSGNYDAAYVLLKELGKNDEIAQSKYDRGIKLIDSGNYVEAYKLLGGLNYKDSIKKLEEILPHYKKSLLSNAEIGSLILFGSYEQDGDTSNGKEPIEWIVLDKDSENALVISKFGLDCQMYNAKDTSVTWETCSLRKWLNSEFLNEAFSPEEQKMIPSLTVTADANPYYNVPPGNNTEDKVFCLSMLEARKYLCSDGTKRCSPTAYAVGRNAWKDEDGICWYWLRSPGRIATGAAVVDRGGNVNSDGYFVCTDDVAVRPALRI